MKTKIALFSSEINGIFFSFDFKITMLFMPLMFSMEYTS